MNWRILILEDDPQRTIPVSIRSKTNPSDHEHPYLAQAKIMATEIFPLLFATRVLFRLITISTTLQVQSDPGDGLEIARQLG